MYYYFFKYFLASRNFLKWGGAGLKLRGFFKARINKFGTGNKELNTRTVVRGVFVLGYLDKSATDSFTK
jgi:hypothetical protein